MPEDGQDKNQELAPGNVEVGYGDNPPDAKDKDRAQEIPDIDQTSRGGEKGHMHTSSASDAKGSTLPKGNGTSKGKPRRATHIDEPLEDWEREEMEELLNEVVGHLGTIYINSPIVEDLTVFP